MAYRDWRNFDPDWRPEPTVSDRLREALPKVAGLCLGQEDEAVDVVVAAARRFLALTETGPDYEAARRKFTEIVESGKDISPEADESNAKAIVDAAFADYLTEERDRES